MAADWVDETEFVELLGLGEGWVGWNALLVDVVLSAQTLITEDKDVMTAPEAIAAPTSCAVLWLFGPKDGVVLGVEAPCHPCPT